jgi:DNA-binding transcriptional ArsR family regulator
MRNLWIFNEGRIAILCKLLGCNTIRGCDLKECLEMKRPILSHHLGILRDNGIIGEQKEGREKYYYIKPGKRAFVKEVVRIVK